MHRRRSARRHVSLVASLLDGREALIKQMRRLLGDERDADAEQRRRADAETDAAAEHDELWPALRPPSRH